MAKIEVSNGELFDKYSILKIKETRVIDNDKSVNIKLELDTLFPIFNAILLNHNKEQDYKVFALYETLFTINEELWVVEDKLRELEANKFWESDELKKEFIDLARSVYILNDNRAKIKREINDFTKSTIIEEKLYEKY